ncbi:MAG TPA: ABC transporter substrate binding protein [Casimicrobiaceae bacterium]|nr:ABC transporter substrate binding protein [Casimicrobiaceae bacterium]
MVAAFITCALLAVLALGPSAAAAQLLLVVSDGAEVYGEVAKEIERRVHGGDRQARIDTMTAREASSVDPEGLRRYALVVTVGVDAARATMSKPTPTPSPSSPSPSTRPPILALLAPRDRFGELAKSANAERDGRISAIFIEQPLVRQLDLVSLALPARTRVGVVLGPTSAGLARDLEDAARAAGLELRRAQANDAAGVYPALQQVLMQSDVLLALPDAVAINAATIRSVLLASHRAAVPVVGFSQALVDAGALLAVYSTPQQYARQAAEIALDVVARNAPLPSPQYPRYFTVGVNFVTAQAIGLALDDEATLAAALAVRTRDREKDRARTQSNVVMHAAKASR